ncbi:Negative elongation factor A, partial [Trichostrongylus colubriformis]
YTAADEASLRFTDSRAEIMADLSRGGALFPSTSQTSVLKDMDLVNWLEKKLSDAGVWSGRMTASMLSREMLEELETCFQAIDVQTKLKIISCIPHMNPRKLSMVHAALLTLLDLASKDADDWVETIADMYRDMPSTGVIIPVCTNKDSHFAKTLEDLTKCCMFLSLFLFFRSKF